MKLTAEANRQGFRAQNMRQMQQFMHQTGIAAEVEQFFPDIAPNLDEFVAAYASDNPMWKRSVLDRIAANGHGAPAPSGGSDRIERVTGAPESLSRKGGTRSISPNSDQAEFDRLESAFRSDPITFPDKKYDRYQALGKKLDKDGFD